ncbi:unnamed protein product, partial [marine sediment metagenome]
MESCRSNNAKGVFVRKGLKQNMGKKWNIVFILADEHGKLIQNEEAVTKEQYGSKDRLERLNLKGQGYIEFSNTA